MPSIKWPCTLGLQCWQNSTCLSRQTETPVTSLGQLSSRNLKPGWTGNAVSPKEASFIQGVKMEVVRAPASSHIPANSFERLRWWLTPYGRSNGVLQYCAVGNCQPHLVIEHCWQQCLNDQDDWWLVHCQAVNRMSGSVLNGGVGWSVQTGLGRNSWGFPLGAHKEGGRYQSFWWVQCFPCENQTESSTRAGLSVLFTIVCFVAEIQWALNKHLLNKWNSEWVGIYRT